MLEDKEQKKTQLSEIGEFGLIKLLTDNIKIKNKSTIKGVGDDAAVIKYDNKHTVVTTDLLIENVHFDLMYMPLKHLGYKSVIVNLSDVFAMNAMPKQITVSLAISNKFSVEVIEEIYSGMLLACDKYNVDLVGGDTTSSNSGLVISITALGEVNEKDIVYRSTAKENDLLCVSGDLGSAYLGLLLLEREKKIFMENNSIQPDLEGHDYILERQLKPEARVDIIEMFKERKFKPTSMIDISDGLASEILHICNLSSVGCKLYEDKIPIDPTAINMARELDLDPTTCVLNGGEDYELLFTIQQADYDKIKNDPNITVIGHITHKSEGVNLVARQNTLHPLTAQGWDAFLKKQKDEDNKRIMGNGH